MRDRTDFLVETMPAPRFVVVRLPSHCIDPDGTDFTGRTPDGTLYRGVDRLPWCDAEQEMHDGVLPEVLLREFKDIVHEGRRGGLRGAANEAIAVEFAARANATSLRTEVVCGSFFGDDVPPRLGYAERMGVDVLVRGGWSLVAECARIGSVSRSDSVAKLNGFGLLPSTRQVPDLVGDYLSAVRRDETEPLPWSPARLIVLEVFARSIPA